MKAYIIYTNDFDGINQYYELERAYMETSTHTEGVGKDSREVAKISIDEIKLLLKDLLSLTDGRDYAVEILKEQYGMELGERKTEDDILDWLLDQIKGGKANEKIQETKRD